MFEVRVIYTINGVGVKVRTYGIFAPDADLARKMAIDRICKEFGTPDGRIEIGYCIGSP